MLRRLAFAVVAVSRSMLACRHDERQSVPCWIAASPLLPVAHRVGTGACHPGRPVSMHVRQKSTVSATRTARLEICQWCVRAPRLAADSRVHRAVPVSPSAGVTTPSGFSSSRGAHCSRNGTFYSVRLKSPVHFLPSPAAFEPQTCPLPLLFFAAAVWGPAANRARWLCHDPLRTFFFSFQ